MTQSLGSRDHLLVALAGIEEKAQANVARSRQIEKRSQQIRAPLQGGDDLVTLVQLPRRLRSERQHPTLSPISQRWPPERIATLLGFVLTAPFSATVDTTKPPLSRGFSRNLPGKLPWALTGSNRRPLPCKGSALPTELNARAVGKRTRTGLVRRSRRAGGPRRSRPIVAKDRGIERSSVFYLENAQGIRRISRP